MSAVAAESDWEDVPAESSGASSEADWEDVDAPSNSTYHAPSNRVLETPQTLNNHETQFVIDRDVDKKKGFVGQAFVGQEPPFPAVDLPPIPEPLNLKDSFVGVLARSLGRGAKIGVTDTFMRSEIKKGQELQAGELRLEDVTNPRLFPGNLIHKALRAPETPEERQAAIDVGVRMEDRAKETLAALDSEIKGSWMDTTGAETTFTKKIASGLGEATPKYGVALTASFLTKNPVPAMAFFFSEQQGASYMEAREAGESVGDSGRIANQIAVPVSLLDTIGIGFVFKASHGAGFFKRFWSGAVSEGATEGAQSVLEAGVMNAEGVRDQTVLDVLENATLEATIGGIMGGGSHVAFGERVKKNALEGGIPEPLAEEAGAYARENYPSVMNEMATFLEREIAPLARDDASAREFATLMQKFQDGTLEDPRGTFTPEEEDVFNKWVEVFRAGVENEQGVAAVEKTFFDKATAAGLEEDQAVGAAKLLGARADAASKALGVTPMEWYQGHNLDIEVQRTPAQAMKSYQEKLDELNADLPDAPTNEVAKPEVALTEEEQAARSQEIAGFEKRLADANAGTKDVSTKKPIIQYIKALGGVRADGLIAGELRHLGINSKTAPGLFRNNQDAMRDIDNIPTEEFNRALGVAAKDDGNGYVDRDWLLEKLRDEQFGERMGQERPATDESFIQALDKAGLDYRTATAEQVYEALGADADIVSAAADMGVELTPREVRQIRGLMESDPELDVQDAIDEFAERSAIMGDTLFQRDGDQAVIPGAEKASDKQVAEKGMEGRMKSSKAQKPMDEGMFGDGFKQGSLFQDGARGAITFGKDKTLIQLFQDANPSTLLHELGHLFLRDMAKVSKASRRPRVKQDYEIVKDWLGSKDGKLTEAQEEKFARGFEAYLREGKAPKEGLQGIFDRFKKWLTSIYQSAQDLKVDISDDVRAVFDRMLGADYARAEEAVKEKDAAKIAADYAAVVVPPPSSFGSDAGDVLASAKQLAGNIFTPISSRLGRIDPKLKAAVRRYTFETGMAEQRDRERAIPFLNALEKMDEAEYRMFDFALKNRDNKRADELIEKYGMRKEFDAVRELLDDIYNTAVGAGLDVSYLDDYFPRMVHLNKASDYISHLRGRPDWSLIKEALAAEDPMNVFTDEEKAVFVNKWLRGHASAATYLTKPSFTKERVIDYVEPQNNHFYLESGEALLKYISAMRLGIAQREIFGKGESVDESIGAYVLSLVNQGAIDHTQENEVKMLMQALVNSKGPGVFVSWMKNVGYVYLMGSPISAITQIGDLAFSLAKNGYYRTGVSVVKAIAGKSILKKEDLGIDNIAQEFEDNTRASSAVRTVFKLTGLSWMDNIGKQTFIESSYKRLRGEAKKNGAAFKQTMSEIFGEEAESVRKDLMDGTLSDNVKMLLYSELSDMQPVSLAEMPVGYLRGGNWRSLYMLKTYTIKQIDIYRREIFDKLATGEPAQVKDGLVMMTRLGMALMLTGMGADALKDLILGRAMTLSDTVMDNLLKLSGLTKYQIYQSRQDGIGNTLMQMMFVPPLYAPVDNLIKDIQKYRAGKQPAADALSLSYVPIIGKFYYWWEGGGRTKEEKKKKK